MGERKRDRKEDKERKIDEKNEEVIGGKVFCKREMRKGRKGERVDRGESE